jgi:DNA-binding Lrp family transcriptional regulator
MDDIIQKHPITSNDSADQEDEWDLDRVFDPEIKPHLDDISKRILALELENAGISNRTLAKKIGIDRAVVARKRSSVLYARVLARARKTAFELLRECQLEAVKKIKELISCDDKAIALRAAMFTLSETNAILVEKAKTQLALELQERSRNVIQRHEVIVRHASGMPIIIQPSIPIEVVEEKSDIKESSDVVDKAYDELITGSLLDDKE